MSEELFKEIAALRLHDRRLHPRDRADEVRTESYRAARVRFRWRDDFDCDGSPRDGPRAGARLDGPGAQRQKDALLDELIRVEVLAAAAREAGFDKDPEFVSNIKRLLAERYLREKLAPPAETLAVKDAEVAQYYDEHKADFGAVERRRAALIFLRVPASASEEAKQAARARAEAALAEAGKQVVGQRKH